MSEAEPLLRTDGQLLLKGLVASLMQSDVIFVCFHIPTVLMCRFVFLMYIYTVLPFGLIHIMNIILHIINII